MSQKIVPDTIVEVYSGVTFIKIGEQIPHCKNCKHITCVCDILNKHKKGCRFRLAATCAIAIACDPHGRDTCPECDPCTCGEL